METLVGKYMNISCGTDCSPYEIVEQINEKTIKLRAMDTEFDKENCELDFQIGGFSAHCSNQHSQKWIITSNPKNHVFVMTKRKNGFWYRKGCPMTRWEHNKPADKPYKFYDYNF